VAAISLREVLRSAGWDRSIRLSSGDRARMQAGMEVLSSKIAAGERVYGVTQGYGPLVGFRPDPGADMASGLFLHLDTGQGHPLRPVVTRLMVWLRLEGMRRGHSAIAPERWERLAAAWNKGFTPVVPREGTVSASGDLAPLARAALAYSGVGDAWIGSPEDGWRPGPASVVLGRIGCAPTEWTAREALAFVNGTSASLALIAHNHVAVRAMARVLAALTGRIATLLGCSPQAYDDRLAEIRGHPGHREAAQWIRCEMDGASPSDDRPLQEPYSLRCAPQVIGAVVDQLALHETVLLREASGCTDNPVVVGGGGARGAVLHGGNFHAVALGLCSDQLSLCVHQLAFLAERQLALLLDPAHNGGRPPMLTPKPGAASGLAGLQLSATSMVARIRQLASPATLTALPTNLGNQDIVPMALNGANAAAEMIELAWLVVGSLTLAVQQLTYFVGGDHEAGFWSDLYRGFEPIIHDRPLGGEVRTAAATMQEAAEDWPTELTTRRC
jgi:histidine ammonia-lyase